MKKLLPLFLLTVFSFSCHKNQLIEKPLVASLNSTETTTYGIVTCKIIGIDDTHAQIIVQKNTKILELRSLRTKDGIFLQSTTGLVYYTWQSGTGVIVEINLIPFSTIGITPPANMFTCLQNAVKLCKTSGVCKGIYFTNIFGATSFSFGMTLKCALGY